MNKYSKDIKSAKGAQGAQDVPDQELMGSSSHPLIDMDDDVPQLLVDDLPPLYSDVATDGGPATEGHVPGVGVGSAAHDPLLGEEEGVDDVGIIDLLVQNRETGAEGQPTTEVVVPQLDDDRDLLFRYINHWAETPPRPFVQLVGTHTQTVDRNGKKETNKVTDFDVRVELTPYLFSDAQRRQGVHSIWNPSKYDKVRRGTVFRCQDLAADEGDANETHGPRYWCTRYAEDQAPLKSFRLERHVIGFNKEKVRTQLEQLVRRTNYRGHLSITFPVHGAELVIYNDNRLNRWRLLRWLRIVCVLTLMIVFTWPFLFFRTKRYETVGVHWYFSQPTQLNTVKYTSLSEDQWCNLWGRAIHKAVLGRRQGLLDQNDLREAEGAEETFQTGNETVDGAVNFVQAGINAMGHINRQFGWGGDC